MSKGYFTSSGICSNEHHIRVRWRGKEPNPFGSETDTWFEDDQIIQWVHEGEASINFYHGGKLVKSGNSYGDSLGGYLSCFETAMTDAQQSCKEYSITRESTMYLRLVGRIESKPTLGAFAEGEKTSEGADPWTWGSDVAYKDYPVGIQEAITHKLIERKFHSEMVLFDSRFTDRENRIIYDKAIQLFEDEDFIRRINPVSLS